MTAERRLIVSRNEIYEEMKRELGLIPSFFREIPDDALEHEWRVFKRMEMGKGHVPLKYRELIGLAIAGVNHCQYCTQFHTEMARLHGATEEEIEYTNRVAKNTVGWSTYLNGMQVDRQMFSESTDMIPGQNAMNHSPYTRHAPENSSQVLPYLVSSCPGPPWSDTNLPAANRIIAASSANTACSVR